MAKRIDIPSGDYLKGLNDIIEKMFHRDVEFFLI